MARALAVILGTVLSVSVILGGAMVGGLMLVSDGPSQTSEGQTASDSIATTRQPTIKRDTTDEPISTQSVPTADTPESVSTPKPDTTTSVPEVERTPFRLVPEDNKDENPDRKWFYEDFEWFADNPDNDDDGDYVRDEYEREVEGLIVGEKDSDGDTVPDGAELAGFPKRTIVAEGPPGNKFDADPQERDLVVDIVYSDSAIDRLSESDIEDLEEKWESFPSEYSIDAHIEVNENITFEGEYPQDFNIREAEEVFEEEYGSGSIHRMVVVTGFSNEDIGGRANLRGHISVVRHDVDYRQGVIIHELMHNIIGMPPNVEGCSPSPGHSCDGYLAEYTGDFEPKITDNIERWLKRDWEI
ncbi:hypothetical protein [Halorientalis regularis]|uniref:Uncharacterized protein n=1 Tax=Halorientalis regularis TaxID=660518 RepID=A0A1G7SKB7_9EURY|nr:hypothetical protein [Halorientalis regularis]SDG23324.1 hypothetical protein SAMN05216218_1193 [Halorientalis regularis]